MELIEIIKQEPNEIFQYILNNPSEEKSILDLLKVKEKDKFFKVSLDLKSSRLNSRGSAAVKKDILETFTKDNSIITIDVDNISMNPNQPRKEFDEQKLVELSESIKLHGLLEPIVVADVNGSFILIAGERRYRAHKIAGLDKIMAIVLKDLDDLQIEELAIIENIQRVDLNCIEEAIAYKKLQDIHGYSIRQLEERLSIPRNTIHSRLKIMDFAPELIEYIIIKQLFNVSLLNEILKCDVSKHKKLLEDMAENKLTAKIVKEQSDAKEDAAPVKKEVIANQYPFGLKPISGVKIKSDKKKLSLEINYKDFEGKNIEKIQEYIQEIIEQSIKKNK